MNTFSTKLTSDQLPAVLTHLQEGNYEPHHVAYAQAAGKKPGLSLVLYQSGKLVAQGKGVKEWLEFFWEPVVTGVPKDASPAADSNLPLPRIGIDESGKGDFFGPMVVAAYALHADHQATLDTLGVKDSKQIKSAAKIRNIAEALLKSYPTYCEVLMLAPETYNRLVAKMGSVNRVLAWGHATVLENLLTKHPVIQHATADQFGPEHQILSALKTKGKGINLKQMHKAESDPAVAAASILARHHFVIEMEKLSQLAGEQLPRGATHVRETGESLVSRAGPEILTRLAKTHFRTTRQVLQACGHQPDLLGTPEPKDSSRWKKRS